MGVLSSGEGRSRAQDYQNRVDQLKRDIRNNFYDMDLENNKRRDAIETIVEELERSCDEVYSSLSSLSFQ